MRPRFGPRRGERVEIESAPRAGEAAANGSDPGAVGVHDLAPLETFDLVYRTLCAILYNYAPTSGHPGGSVSSGRFVAPLLFGGMEYDLSDPERTDADRIVYAAGHKALGLYALWALRDEIARIARPQLLPGDVARRLRLEDLLGFRRNPITGTPLMSAFGAKALDGHPTPATPFVPLATGASGVGMASALGLALAAADVYGVDAAPRVHVIEGEGGLTPGRVSEALAFAGTASLGNVVVHVDWNQASIDSEHVTREGSVPGDYVQWEPAELFWLHDWNVVVVGDGTDPAAIAAAQRRALEMETGQPTAIIYRTTKGWRYGIEGRASHGAGHALCSAGFYQALAPLLGEGATGVPHCEPGHTRCLEGTLKSQVEACYWDALGLIRRAVEQNGGMAEALADRLADAERRLDARGRVLRKDVPRVERAFAAAGTPGTIAAQRPPARPNLPRWPSSRAPRPRCGGSSGACSGT